jgi:predicted metalloprotease with PDZ domain
MILHTALLISSILSPTIKLTVDAREITRGLYHITEQFSAKPGKLTLWYPKWIPGWHAPGGPVNDNIRFRISVDGKVIPWKRDLVDTFEVTAEVPPNSQQVTVEFTQADDSGSAHLARVSWNSLIWYPAGSSDTTSVQASIILPEKWEAACAIHSSKPSPGRVDYEEASLTRLIDSPAQIGRYYKQYDVTGKSPIKHYLEVMADTPEGVIAPKEALDHVRRIHEEMEAITGGVHYREYHWLLTLSDHGAGAGLEHHESSEDGVTADGFGKTWTYTSELLSHEYFHSFNGKFRRPEGLCTPDYQKPMKDEMLWVYEGMTQYMGHLLNARAGSWSPAQWRDQMAINYNDMNTHRGREWRPLVDTAIGVPAINFWREGPSWTSARRPGGDYYFEMTIVWLEVDMKIRELTGGKSSLIDFERIFHGAPFNGPELKPYTFESLVADLNKVARYDWGALLRERVYQVQPDLSTKSFEMAGWKIVYNDEPNSMTGQAYGGKEGLVLSSSLGLTVKDDGTVVDVVPGYPVDKGGLSPGMKIISINGTKYTDETITQAAKAGGTIDMVVNYKEDIRHITVQYAGGLRYPHLERIAGTPDRFEDLLKSLAKP